MISSTGFEISWEQELPILNNCLILYGSPVFENKYMYSEQIH